MNADYPYQYEGDFTLESGYQGAAKLVKMENRPTAMIIMNNMMAIGALKYIKQHGIEVPEELSLASFEFIDNIEILSIQPVIASSNPYVMGSRVGEMMLERIKDATIPNREIIYQPQLFMGNGIREI